MAAPLKQLAKKIWKKMAGVLFTKLNLRRARSSKPYLELVQREQNQINLMRSQYPELIREPGKRGRWQIHERKIYSQNGEDGLLLHIFSKIGAPHQTFIEFGIEDGRECNAANLAIHFGWHGLFIDGSPSLADRARSFYHRERNLSPRAVQIACAFVTRENVNELFSSHGFRGPIDLLSIDIDGNDYWIWEAIAVVAPRVVVIEYNASFGPDRAITVKYDPAFDRYQKHPSGWYHGASVTALAKLAAGKGYVLVGCDSSGANAFFVRQELAAGKLDEFTAPEAFYPSEPRLREMDLPGQYALVRHLEYVEI